MSEVEETKSKPSTVDSLITIASIEYEVVHTTDGDYLAYPLEGPKVAIPLFGMGATLSDRLMRRHKETLGKTPSKRSVEEAIRVLISDASLRPQVVTFIRNAKLSEEIFIDIGDQTGEAIYLSQGVWEIIERPPVYFRRSALTAPLIRPVRGGKIDALFISLNIDTKMRHLLKGFLIASLDPTIPIPLIALNGEQGSGKSTFTKLLRALIDPSPVPLQSPPSNEASWIEIAGSSRLIALDNLSNLQEWLSDVLCRAVTGGGKAKRKHYSDKELVIYDFKRVIILNGINLSITRDDLADRILPLTLHVISDTERKFESEIYGNWNEEFPKIFGALLSLAARVHERVPHVEMSKLPRMADFARVLQAMDELEGSNSLDTYRQEIGIMATTAVELDSFLQAIVREVSSQWSGSASELLSKLDVFRPYREDADWPNTPRQVTERITRGAPVLRKIGWTVDDMGSNNQSGVKRWSIKAPELGR